MAEPHFQREEKSLSAEHVSKTDSKAAKLDSLSKLTKDEFIQKSIELLQCERNEEIEQTSLLLENVPPKELQRKGVCLLKLRIGSRHTGMYGRSVVVFEPFWSDKELPSHNLTPGDIVGLGLSQDEGVQNQLSSGIVSRVGQNAVSVAFDESYDSMALEDEEQYKLTKLANDVTYKRIKKALDKLNSYVSGPSGALIDVLFAECQPSPPMPMNQELTFFNTNLDESQQDAVKFALHQKEMSIIHGPPGTGKTTTVIEIVLQAIKQNLKILACAPSNIAVDNLVERLANYKKKVVRLGHPARLLPHIQRYSLDAILSASDETKLVADVRRDLDQTLSKLKKCRGQGERQKLREEMKHFRKELRQRESDATREILKHAEVVSCTLTSATDDGPMKHLERGYFDLVIIDECSQALEAACWIALTKASRCILAGDHHQLPPTILSQKAAKEGLELTLMERQLKLHGDDVVRMLTTQYRMHELIMQWSSDQLYDGKLLAHESVAQHTLKDLPNVEMNEDTSTPLLMIDTTGCDLYELDLPEEVSKGNEGEADLVAVHVEKLVNSGLEAENIAVIAPYNLQVDLIRLRLSHKYPKLEIKSVDGFQGREKEAVIISLVRSNDKGEIGFLAENRRINVAITRARRHLTVVCDTTTVSHHDFLKSLVEYMMKNGEVRSAHEYTQVFSIGEQPSRPEHLQQRQQYLKGAKPKKIVTKQPNKTKHLPSTAATRTPSNTMTSHDAGKSESVDMVWKEEIQKTVAIFLADDDKKTCSFPPSLKSYQRFFIHEIAENLQLEHCSQGEGDNRHILITKPGTSQHRDDSGCNDTAAKEEPRTDGPVRSGGKVGKVGKNTVVKPSAIALTNSYQTLANDEKEQRKSVQKPSTIDREKNEVIQTFSGDWAGNSRACSVCGKNVPEKNYELHSLQCARRQKQEKENRATEMELKGSKKKSKKPKPVNASVVLESTDKDDFDALIAEASTLNSKCNFPKCKTNVRTLGMNCEFCSQRFCLNHHIPEVHGCGDAAKGEARRRISKEGVLYSGSGKKNMKPDPTKRMHMQRRLDKKVGEMADNRKRKQKDDK